MKTKAKTDRTRVSAKGRPERELLPLGGTARSAKGAHVSAKGRPERELLPLGGTARSAKGANLTVLEDLPNVGPAIAADFRRIGIRTPRALAGRDPYALYEALNRATGTRHDPCVLDTFIAVVRFMDGAPARPWWTYTAERKRALAARTTRKRSPASRAG